LLSLLLEEMWIYGGSIVDSARLDIFTVVKMQVAVFWVMTLYSDVVGYQCLGGPCCLHLHLDDGFVKGSALDD